MTKQFALSILKIEISERLANATQWLFASENRFEYFEDPPLLAVDLGKPKSGTFSDANGQLQ